MNRTLSCDVVVVGSGAGGLLAAIKAHDLGLKAVVIEKADHYGGTSSVSGGGIWIPNNADVGTADSSESALEYLRACTMDKVPQEKLKRYIAAAPEMVAYLKELGIEYYANPQVSNPDYYPGKQGALPTGRTMTLRPMDGSILGDDFFRMREGYPEMKLLGNINIGFAEGKTILSKEKGWKRILATLIARYYSDVRWRRRTHRDRRLTIGAALIGRLRKAMLDRDIPLLLGTRLKEIIRDGDRVTGIQAEQNGNSLRIDAKRGVILASGGFEQSQMLRDRYLGQHSEASWSATPCGGNTGDALVAALAIGADTEFLNEAWWTPTAAIPDKAAPNLPRHYPLFVERAFPHSLAVNRLGKRFADETLSYHQFGQAMLEDNLKTGANMPCWLIFDAQYRKKYPVAWLLPGSIQPDRKLPLEWFGSFIFKGATIADLAQQIDVPAGALQATVARFNEGAKAGIDTEFQRGDHFYAQYFGDPAHKPNRVMGPLDKAPFYALRMDLGDLGTKGGPKTDEHGAVLDREGHQIPGLYAVGNVAGSVMGGAYPGAGATLGSSMTFACLAATHAAGRATA